MLAGAIDVVVLSALLMPAIGILGVYYANVGNGVITTLCILTFAIIKNRRFPRSMDELMVIPDDFGASPEDRMTFTVRDLSEIGGIAKEIRDFCMERGTDEHKAYAAGLAMEEMAENIVEYGFIKDKRDHSIDVRVVHRGDNIILLIKDDCVAFNPSDLRMMAERERTGDNGLRLVFGMAEDVQYQNILGLNILTIRI